MEIKFTPREMDILKMLCLENKLIGAKLFLSLSTIKTYVTRILNKLGVDNRQIAQIKAIKLGIISLEEIITE